MPALVFLLIFAAYREARLRRYRTQSETEIQQTVDQLQARERQQQADQEAVLADSDFISGEKARRARESEWLRRLAHEPKLARTPLERAILEMERVAASTDIPADKVLKRVAEISAPRGSRIEVVPKGDNFIVNVAFRLSATTGGEAGAVTKHHTVAALRREVLEITSRVIRDLYDHCGRRNIERINVACNHAVRQAQVPLGATELERRRLLALAPVTWTVFYRGTIPSAAAQNVSSWRKLPLHRVTDMLVGEDGYARLTIDPTPAGRSELVDPAEQLQF